MKGEPSAEDLKVQHERWGTFIGDIAIQEKLVSTHRLNFDGKQIHPDGSVTPGFYLANQQAVSGNMIVRANGLDEAVEMAKGCPILTMGGTVEVRQINPM